MTVINVTSPQLRDEIKKKLLENESPKYRYIKNNSPIEMQFEVEDGFEPKRVLSITKKLIRSLKYGNVIMFRVLIDGQFFEGGKVYTPADREYLATRPAGNPVGRRKAR